jgi:uncharacterized protein YegL
MTITGQGVEKLKDTVTLWRIVLLIIAIFIAAFSAQAQAPEQKDLRRPIDMIVALDNSCSMFPDDLFPSICYNTPGNDAEFLRIHGTNLFLAALGLGELNEDEYQLGIIEFGDNARLISPLQPITRVMRGDLARAIANPTPIPYTDMEEAMELAFSSLRNSPNRKSTNLPAVVLITDGIPDKSGQTGVDSLSEARTSIGQIVENNKDIPLFIMLLKGNEVGDYVTLYEDYIAFWQELRNENDQIFVYLIEDASQIDETYNEIISHLQNTVSTPGLPVAPGEPLKVFVNRYVQRLVIKVDHGLNSTSPRGTVQITDPKKNIVADNDKGVDRFSHPDNPWEAIVIASERLDWDENNDGVFDLKDDFWQVESDQPVSVFIDLRDAYRFNFLEPETTLVDVGIPNIYLAINRQSPIKSLVIRFNLLDKANNIIFEPQPITGKVLHPDGSEAQLRIPASLEPDGSGTYQIFYDYTSTYTGSLDGLNRFTFFFEAGSSEIIGGSLLDPVKISSAVAASRLLVDVGRGAYIDSVSPVLCAANQPAEVRVSLSDYEYSNPATIRLRLFDGTKEVILDENSAGIFIADVASLCQPLFTSLACSTESTIQWTVSLVAQTLEGYPIQSQQNVPVQILAPACTPTPAPSPTPTPTPPPPTPTPIPDTDGDGGNDLIDQCPNEPGIEMFGWCPVPWWAWLILTVGIIVLAVLLRFMVWPWLLIGWISPPPQAYISICTGDRATSKPAISIKTIGEQKKTNRITIGSSRKAAIVVPDLREIEFIVVKEGDKVVLKDDKDATKATFSKNVSPPISTSKSGVTLKICLEQVKSLYC